MSRQSQQAVRVSSFAADGQTQRSTLSAGAREMGESTRKKVSPSEPKQNIPDPVTRLVQALRKAGTRESLSGMFLHCHRRDAGRYPEFCLAFPPLSLQSPPQTPHLPVSFLWSEPQKARMGRKAPPDHKSGQCLLRAGAVQSALQRAPCGTTEPRGPYRHMSPVFL